MDSLPLDVSEHSQYGVDPQLRPFIRCRIEETVEAAGHQGAEAQRLAAMVCASIDEFLPTRVQWASAYWARVASCLGFCWSIAVGRRLSDPSESICVQ